MAVYSNSWYRSKKASRHDDPQPGRGGMVNMEAVRSSSRTGYCDGGQVGRTYILAQDRNPGSELV